MYLEVVRFPESQFVMDDPDWFFIQAVVDNQEDLLGSSAYARIIDKIPELPKQSITLCQDDEWQGGDDE